YRVLYDTLPGFSQLRNPGRIFWITDIALAMLGALGVDSLLRRERPKHVLSAVLVVDTIVVLVIAGTLLQLEHYAHRPDELQNAVQHNPNIFDDVYKPLHAQAARDAPRLMMQGPAYPEWIQIAAGVAALIIATLLSVRGQTARWTATALALLLTV